MASEIQRWAAPRRRRSTILSAITVAGAAVVLAACSSTGSTTGTTAGTGAASSGATAGGAGMASTLSTRQLSGVGTALVDQSGMTVYTPDQEAGGKIQCTASCLSFWTPVTVASSVKPTMPSGVTGTVGTITRPDNGQMQVTFNGMPLYTFRLDHAPGDDHGENFTDSFGGTSFTWRAISASGSAAPGGVPAPQPSNSLDYGYGGGSSGY